jgi:biopolymer transport protein ExbD
MADVAFLLLIFFLATTTIAEEFGLTLILPARSNTPPKQINRDNVMVIGTNENGSIILIDGEAASVPMIRPAVRERQAANDKLVISVEPHPQAPYRSMVDILDELKLAEARRISLKTTRR